MLAIGPHIRIAVLKTDLVGTSCVFCENSKTGFKLFTPGVFFVCLFVCLFCLFLCFAFLLLLLLFLFHLFVFCWLFLFVFFFILKRVLKTSIDVCAMSG